MKSSFWYLFLSLLFVGALIGCPITGVEPNEIPVESSRECLRDGGCRSVEQKVCKAPLQNCNNECVNPKTDPNHCGQCDQFCSGELVCHQGKCGCADGKSVCGERCVDLQNDAANCGRCGHDCRGTSCSKGQCGATQLASKQPVPTDLIVGKQYLYWVNTEGDAVMRVLLSGGKPEVFVGSQKHCNNLILDGNTLYWSSLGGKIWKADINTAKAAVFVNEQQLPDGLAVDDTHLYWVSSLQRGKVLRIPRAGGKIEELAKGPFPHRLEVDDTWIFWTEISSGKVLRRNKKTGETIAISDKEPDPNGLAMDADHVYWTNLDAGTIRKAPKSGKGPVVTLASKQGNPHHLTVGSRYVYWANNASGTIMAVDKKGGKPFVVSSGYTIPYGITLGTKFIYWTTGIKDGAVFKVAR